MPNEKAECAGGNKASKQGEPRQLLRIRRKKMANGLIKLELRYVSYQHPNDASPSDEEIAAGALTALNQSLSQNLM